MILPIEEVGVIYGHFVGAILISTAIEERYVEATLDDHLVAQLVSKAKTRTEMAPVDICTVVACAAGAVAKLGCRTRNATGRRIGTRIVLIEVNDLVVQFSKRNLNVPTNAQVKRQPWATA